MHASDALYFPGKFHQRRAVVTARFHITVGSQFREHLALNPAFLCPDGLALTRGKWRTVRRFLRLNALLLPLAQFLLQCRRSSGDARREKGPLSTRRACPSKGLKSFIPFTHQFAITPHLNRARHRLRRWRLRDVLNVHRAVGLFDLGALGQQQADADIEAAVVINVSVPGKSFFSPSSVVMMSG